MLTLDVDMSSFGIAGFQSSVQVIRMIRAKSQITAVLGPTNTGKTHLAIERMCAHSSGIMGFPLRLLAREVYDRVVALKGERAVGLITGEERIMPPDARWLLCTAESLPLDRDVAFAALDEAQLGTDAERGHVFTNRLFSLRGREETMILGSESFRPMIRAFVPEAEIVGRPRFSSLNYAGPKKLNRLPPRSAIVAFSADEVYAVAEALRRTRGGAAIVMGALSPATRNAQVALFQSGEVDYLVATDAIGMGLNLDLGHVAFAGLSKFDGKKQRRLTLPEMAQIAGRAGRHQRDGTFGVIAGGDEFTEAEIDRIETHRFEPISSLNWRNTDLDFGSIGTLIESLEVLPDDPALRPAPEAVDLAVLKSLATVPAVCEAATSSETIRRLWEVCGLPDFRKLGAEHHAQLVASIFGFVAAGNIETDWIAREINRLDSVQGNVDTVSARIAQVRTWAYVSHRRDWLADPAHWAGKTRALEQKLSDALHQKLIERFVDRRTAVLMRAMADEGWHDVAVSEGGIVTVDDEPIGALTGFKFRVDPHARLGERKRLLSAAQQFLPRELARRAEELTTARDEEVILRRETDQPIALFWRGAEIAKLRAGPSLIAPRIELDPAIRGLPPAQWQPIEARLQAGLAQTMRRLGPLFKLEKMMVDPSLSGSARAVIANVIECGGHCPRLPLEEAMQAIPREERHRLRRAGLVLGSLDIFHPQLLKPQAAQLRVMLDAVKRDALMPPLPMAGLGLIDRPSVQLAAGAQIAGYRRFGNQMLRIDLVERIARAVHEKRGKAREVSPDPAVTTAYGVNAATAALIMRALGFNTVGDASANVWRWTGRPRRKASAAPTNPAFAALEGLKKR